MRVEPAADYGCNKRQHALGAGHISYAGDQALRLTTDARTEAIVSGRLFHVHQTVTLIFGQDDPGANAGGATTVGAAMLERTADHWRHWTSTLEAPAQWREAVIRAAITLELNVYEPTGAIVASMTTSIPEAPDSGRTWDYRYCWPRDAYFTADALCRLGDTRTVEHYLDFLLGVAARAQDSRLAPIYSVDGGPIPGERIAKCLPGYRGMGPVHVGNKASEQDQHDLYGEAVLTAESLFLNLRASRAGDETLLSRLEAFGEQASRLYEVPDAGLWSCAAPRAYTRSRA